MITLCSVAHFADRHRDASRRHHPTPHRLSVSCATAEVLAVRWALPAFSSRTVTGVNALHARSKLKNAKPQILHAMTGVNTHVKGAYAHTLSLSTLIVGATIGEAWVCRDNCGRAVQRPCGRDMSLL
jgi:hypothetical protein